MAMLEKAQWDSSFATGINVVDQQHQKLFALFNELVEVIESESDSSNIIEELIDYTEYHFSCEESFMETYNDPGKNEHMGQHTAFISEVMELIQNRSIDDETTYLRSFANFLKSWLVGHIKGTDRTLIDVVPADARAMETDSIDAPFKE